MMEGYGKFLVLLVLQVSAKVFNNTELVDFCIEDGFIASCQDGKVLLMQEAYYGRMQFGKCLKYDIGLGCKSEVLSYMDIRCSGRQACNVNLRPLILLTLDCPLELTGYLQTRYSCMPVLDAEQQCCQLPGQKTNVSIEGGTMISIIPATMCMAIPCPANIRVYAGQYISISLYSFNVTTTEPPQVNLENNHFDNHLNRCYAYLNVKEEGIGVRFALCGSSIRKRQLYLSSTNEVEILIVTEEEEVGSRSIIEYEAIGCRDPVPPQGGYMVRSGDRASIKCRANDVTWEIVCRQSKWYGHVGNCSEGATDSPYMDNGVQDGMHFSPIVAIAFIISLAIFIAVVIILAGIICIKRNQRNQRSQCRAPPIPMSHATKHRKSSKEADLYYQPGQKASNHPLHHNSTPIMYPPDMRSYVHMYQHSELSNAVSGSNKSRLDNPDLSQNE